MAFLSFPDFVLKSTGTDGKAMEEATSPAKLFTADQFWTRTYYTIFALRWLDPFLFFLPVRPQFHRFSQVNVPDCGRLLLGIGVQQHPHHP